MNRRKFIMNSGLVGASPLWLSKSLAAQQAKDKKFVFVVAAAGGASIIDGFLAQTSGPAAYQAGQLGPDTGLPFRSPVPLDNSIQGVIPLGNGYDINTFLSKHGNQTAVMTCEVSSVNHLIAAERAVTGDNINRGRTITEEVSFQYSGNSLLPNIALSAGGYGSPGRDITLSDLHRPVPVSDPLMFAFATHGYKGIKGGPGGSIMERSRILRYNLEKVSKVGQSFAKSDRLKAYLHNREKVARSIERGDSISKLLLLDPATNQLESFGLKVSADLENLFGLFPNMAEDPMESQTALAFLLASSGMSNAITFGPSGKPVMSAEGTPNSPIAFDWSHLDHRGAQNAMWGYILSNLDKLIDLLKATDIDGDPAKGKMWDKSLIYVATEFGRDKVASGGSGHHLNNGVAIISPMIKGGNVFGGVKADTGITYGFDPMSGEPIQGTTMNEKHIYSAIATALDLDFPGRIEMACLKG